jgi:hypothetical protein
MLKRYVRYLNYAQALRTIAADRRNYRARDAMTTVADEYEQIASSLNSILRTKAQLER